MVEFIARTGKVAKVFEILTGYLKLVTKKLCWEQSKKIYLLNYELLAGTQRLFGKCSPPSCIKKGAQVLLQQVKRDLQKYLVASLPIQVSIERLQAAKIENDVISCKILEINQVQMSIHLPLLKFDHMDDALKDQIFDAHYGPRIIRHLGTAPWTPPYWLSSTLCYWRKYILKYCHSTRLALRMRMPLQYRLSVPWFWNQKFFRHSSISNFLQLSHNSWHLVFSLPKCTRIFGYIQNCGQVAKTDSLVELQKVVAKLSIFLFDAQHSCHFRLVAKGNIPVQVDCLYFVVSYTSYKVFPYTNQIGSCLLFLCEILLLAWILLRCAKRKPFLLISKINWRGIANNIAQLLYYNEPICLGAKSDLLVLYRLRRETKMSNVCFNTLQLGWPTKALPMRFWDRVVALLSH